MAKTKSHSNGKLIDTWYYEYEGIPSDPEMDDDENAKRPEPKVKDIKVPVKLYLYKKFKSDTPPLSVSEVWFGVECATPEIDLQGSDIEALRAAMWEHLDKHYEVRWETYYLVEIRQNGPYSGMGTGLTFGYDTVSKGTAFDGTLLLKQYQYSRGFVISPWPGEFRDRQGTVIACIPSNDLTRSALEAFSKRIDLLREKLVDLVRPEEIEQTLLNLSYMNLLPAPSDEGEEQL